MSFKIRPRRGLIVYLNSMKTVKSLRRYGHVQYSSRRMHYVVLYVDEENIANTIEKLRQLRNVRKVMQSNWPEIDPELTDLEVTGLYKKHDEDEKE